MSGDAEGHQDGCTDYAAKAILGLVEEVTLIRGDGARKVIARIDSGATKSSVDLRLASELRLGPIVESRMIKSANGAKLRPVIEMTLEIAGRSVTERFTMADRSHMKYKILIGQNILRHGFLIDPCKEIPKLPKQPKRDSPRTDDDCTAGGSR